MSDTERPKSSGDEIHFEEVNRDLPITINAGEAISVVTNPQAVYVKAADGEVYKTDANLSIEATYNFIGFCVTTGADASPCVVQTKGIVSGFTGLTKGSAYYLSDTAGAISTTPSTTHRLKIGIAISTTEILIVKHDELKYYEIQPLGWSTPTASSTWEDWNLSGSIPAGAKYVEIVIRTGGTAGGNWGVRKNGSSVNRYINYTGSSICFNMTVELDAGRIVERYDGNPTAYFTVVGYWK